MIEANPRASRTVPFVSKAIGVPLAKMACRLLLGETLAELGLPADPMAGAHVSVKEAVLPFNRFAGADSLLGPEMRSTGEVMGIAADYETAFAKAQAAAGAELPTRGTVFITVTDADKAAGAQIAARAPRPRLHDRRHARDGRAMERLGVPATTLNKVGEGSPHVVDWIERGDIDLVINTPTGSGARSDGWEIRRAAVMRGIPCITTLSGGQAAARAIGAARERRAPVVSLQEIHAPAGAVVLGSGFGGAEAAGCPRDDRAVRPAFGRGGRAAGARSLRRRARARPARRARPPGAGPVLHAGRRRAAGGRGRGSVRSCRGPARSCGGRARS